MRLIARWMARSSPSWGAVVGAVAFSILAAAASITLLGGSGLLVGKAAQGGDLASLGGLLVLIEVVAFLRAPLRFKERLVAHRVALDSMVMWRSWLFDVVAARVPGSLSDLASGDLLDRSIEDIDALQDLYVRLALPALNTVVTGAMGIAIISVFTPHTGLALALGLIAGCAVTLMVATAAAAATRSSEGARSDVAVTSTDLLLGMTDLTMAGTALAGLGAVEAAERVRARSSRRLADLRAAGTAAVALVSGATLLAALLIAAAACHRGALTPAETAGAVLVVVASLEPLLGLMAAAIRAPEVALSAQRLESLEAAPLATHEPSNPAPWPDGPRDLLIHDLWAPATPGGPAVIQGLSLSIPVGHRVAILGASGAGKSTLCRVLLRFLDPTSGGVSIGDSSLESMAGDEVRRHVTLLDQHPMLFGGSLRDALRLGAPDATDDELLEVLRRCQLTALTGVGVNGSPLDLMIGEDGATLSGGQQRRVGLARALLRRPDILLLDEPTAGLSALQGSEILATCLDAARESTVILVTHDVDHAAGFDQILWLEEGRLTPLSKERIAQLRR